MTEKQIWARKRNWLILRLMGAKSIFTYENRQFMQDIEKDDDYVYKCEDAIDRLIIAMRESTLQGEIRCPTTAHKN